MRLHFFLDWCPFGSASGELNNDLAMHRRNESARDDLEEICNRLLGTAPPALEFAVRQDGLMIFAVVFPETAPIAQINQAALELSYCIKQNALDHEHHHHHSPRTKPIPGYLWNGRQIRLFGRKHRDPTRRMHRPVRTEFPHAIAAGFDNVESKTRAFLNQDSHHRVSDLCQLIRSDEEIGHLYAPYRSGQRILALQLLDYFIAGRHDKAIESYGTLTAIYERRKVMNYLICIAIWCAIFVGLMAGMNSLDSHHTIVELSVSTLIASLFSIGYYIYVDSAESGRIVVAVRSHIGYMSRANDFSVAMSNIYEEQPPPVTVHTSVRGYDSLIGSLNVLVSAVQSEAELNRNNNLQLLTALGIAATVIAILGVQIPS